MSQGLAQYEQTVSEFGNAMDSIRSYTATYDTDFFRDWTEKHNLAMEKLNKAASLGADIGGAYIAGKLAYKNMREKVLGKKDEDEEGDEEGEENTDAHDGDEDGANDAEDGNVGESIEADVADAEPAATVGDADAATVAAPSLAAGEAVDASGVIAGDVEPLGASASPFTLEQAALFTQTPEEAAPATAAATDVPSATATEALQPATDTAAAASDTAATTAAASEPFLSTDTISGTIDLVSGAAAGDIAGTAASAIGAAATGGAAATAEGIGALTAAATAAEAIPVVGIFASIGIGLYELFHHPKKAPAAPPLATVNSKGEMVLPSFDSVTDTPASQSAF